MRYHLQNERIFFASSLSEVMRQLLIYRPTGVLTIWPAEGPRQEDMRIAIERGYPTHVSRSSHWEKANGAILAWLNSWGNLHFSFAAMKPRLPLPAPTQGFHQEQLPLPETPLSSTSPALRTPVKPAQLRQEASTAQPLQVSPPTKKQTLPLHTEPLQNLPTQENFERTYELPAIQMIYQQEKQSNSRAASTPLSSSAHEKVIPLLTLTGKDYPSANLPRYERIIFLLINGRRTAIDLAQLTKRTLEEVSTTLYRLQGLQLITLEDP
jgi:hypothetical protein